MKRQDIIQQAEREIELLARLHIIYDLKDESCFTAQKQKVVDLISDGKINVKRDLDPTALSLYRRYFV